MSTETAAQEAPKKKTGVEDFEFGKTLGEGSFGDVVLCTHKASGARYAAKKIEKQHLIKTGNTKYAVLEREVLTTCKHPNIIKLYYSFRDDACLYYIIELAPGGELRKLIKKKGNLCLEATKFFAAELVSALEYLHTDVNIIHRDLKPENVLLSDTMHVKLTDFGTAKRLKEGEDRVRTASFLGTAEYIAPECLDEEPLVCRASDLWALGCIIYQMLSGSPPFHGDTQFLTFEQVKSGKISYPPHFPYHARLLIEKLLSIDPDGRPTYQEIKSHPFFAGIDFSKLAEISIQDSVLPCPEYQLQKITGDHLRPLIPESEKIYEYGKVSTTKSSKEGNSSRSGYLVLTNSHLHLLDKKQTKIRRSWEITKNSKLTSAPEDDYQISFEGGEKTSSFRDESDFDPVRWRRALKRVIKQLSK